MFGVKERVLASCYKVMYF